MIFKVAKGLIFAVVMTSLFSFFYEEGQRSIPVFPSVRYPHPAYWALDYTYEDGLPQIIYINGNLWRLIRVDAWALRNNEAVTRCESKIILFEDSDVRSRLKETITHELFHAGVCGHLEHNFYWNSYNQYTHEGIVKLGIYWSTLLETNPELAEWYAH